MHHSHCPPLRQSTLFIFCSSDGLCGWQPRRLPPPRAPPRPRGPRSRRRRRRTAKARCAAAGLFARALAGLFVRALAGLFVRALAGWGWAWELPTVPATRRHQRMQTNLGSWLLPDAHVLFFHRAALQVRFNPSMNFGPQPGQASTFRLTVATPRLSVSSLMGQRGRLASRSAQQRPSCPALCTLTSGPAPKPFDSTLAATNPRDPAPPPAGCV